MLDAPFEYNGLTVPADWLCADCGQRRDEHTCPEEFRRSQAHFVGMLRIKNEDRWIAEVIEGALNLCDHLYVLDDHSTDDTAAVCQRYAGHLTFFPSPFSGFNEARDKNWLLDQIMVQCEPEWILCVDGDEVLTKRSAEAIRCATRDPDCPAYSLQILYLWNDRETVRTDWVYGEFWRPSVFRPFRILPDTPDHVKLARDLRFMATPFGRREGNHTPNFHCSSVPQAYIGRSRRCPSGRLLHLGYLHREDRMKKLDFYTLHDWRNLSEDCYRHMTQGDDVRPTDLPDTQALVAAGKINGNDVRFITDLPAEIKHGEIWNGRPLLHAGPLTLKPLAALN